MANSKEANSKTIKHIRATKCLRHTWKLQPLCSFRNLPCLNWPEKQNKDNPHIETHVWSLPHNPRSQWKPHQPSQQQSPRVSTSPALKSILAVAGGSSPQTAGQSLVEVEVGTAHCTKSSALIICKRLEWFFWVWNGSTS